MKIVINSNIHYKKPISILLKSLFDSGFSNFDDVIIVRSQSVDKEPCRVCAKEVCPELPDHVNVVLIEMEMNNFDYNAYHALNLYKDNFLIKDDSYLYVLDTSTFDADFGEKYKNIRVGPSTVLTYNTPHSNICAFGRKVIDNYGDNFSVPLLKSEAIGLEFGRHLFKQEKEIRPITFFGEFKSLGGRLMMETFDIYQTSHPRVKAYYPYFGISKWILWGRNGDITGNVVPN